jgi:signal transduction histidine kinase
MKTNSKVTLLVSIQIILILSSFLTLSYFESEKNKFENSITVAIKIRQLSDSLIFETERYLSDIPYADPQSIIKQITVDFNMIKSGGNSNDLILKPLPTKFINAHNVAMQKLIVYTNHVEKIIKDGNLEIDFTDLEFLNLDTEKFDSNGSLDYLIFTLMEESKIQSNNIIILEIGLAILNVGIHVMMIIFILDILKKQSAKEIRLEKLASIGELSARLAHDLRNPLTVIKGGMELLLPKNSSVSDKQSIERVKMMENAIYRMTHQLENVMDFVRTSKLSLEKNSVLEIIHSSVKRVSIPDSVEITYPDSDYDLKCDKNKLEIVFVNLLSNALDAINNEGKIKIRMKSTNNFLGIEFEDSGPEINQNDLSKVFEPLFTLKQKGTGLGLASCKNIIEQHNGTIGVITDPTIFSIRLPTNL